ncbi:MAG TPA: CBS domain-containing protein [Gemmatimonadaceae bacterium]|nr:CBS domain-containing protein [Gemmatimonadaceae bacterium]
MLRVADIMTTDIASADPDMNLREAIAILADNHVGGAPVIQRGKVVGVFSASDLLAYITDSNDGPPSESLRHRRTSLEDVTVAELMTRELKSLASNCTVEQAADFMRRNQIHRALVMDEGKLVGIVTTTDVVKAVAQHRLHTNTYVFS